MLKNRGVALIQILLFTTILIIFAGFVANKVNTQTNIAQALANKQIAMLKGKSVYSKIKFKLLTYPQDILMNNHGWNFHGEPFYEDGILVSIQDHNGLPDLRNGLSHDLFANLLNLLNIKQNSDSVVNKLNLLIRNRKDTEIQNLELLSSLLGVNISDSEKIWQWISINSKGSFNPMSIPNELMQLFYDDFSSAEIDKIRKQKLTFNEIKGKFGLLKSNLTDEEIDYVIGPYYRVVINSSVEDSHWKMIFELKFEANFKGLDLLLISQRPL